MARPFTFVAPSHPPAHPSELVVQPFTPLHPSQAWIDELDKQLPVLRNFILPSGGCMSAFLHQARAICRRAERSVIPLTRDANVDPQV